MSARGCPSRSIAATQRVLSRQLSYPAERVPERIQPVVALLLPSLTAELMTALWNGRSPFDARLGVLALWCAVFGIIAWRAVAWTDTA